MNIEKADIFTIAQIGNLDLLNKKLNIINKKLDNIKNLKDKYEVSLLQKSIIGRNFDISKLLLDLNANINNISKEGYNELHYISFNLTSKNAINIAKIIIERGGDLNLKDKSYGNTPFNYICQEAIKHKNHNYDFYNFIVFCMKYNPELNIKNFSGITIIDLINNSKYEDLIKLMFNK